MSIKPTPRHLLNYNFDQGTHHLSGLTREQATMCLSIYEMCNRQNETKDQFPDVKVMGLNPLEYRSMRVLASKNQCAMTRLLGRYDAINPTNGPTKNTTKIGQTHCIKSVRNGGARKFGGGDGIAISGMHIEVATRCIALLQTIKSSGNVDYAITCKKGQNQTYLRMVSNTMVKELEKNLQEIEGQLQEEIG